MLTGSELRSLISSVWKTEYLPVVGGLHVATFGPFNRWMVESYGIELQLEYDGENNRIDSYIVKDESKHSWFILKWAH